MTPDPSNPFAAPSPLFLELPPFAEIRPEHYRPAFDAGVAAHLAEIDAITGQAAPPDFENTVVALERSGRLLDRVVRVFRELSGSMSGPEMQALEDQLMPELAAHRDRVLLDPALFARLDDLAGRVDELDLTEEQRRVLERWHLDCVRAGAALSEADQERLRALNERLSRATTRFAVLLLEASNAAAVHVEDAAGLAGLSPDTREAAALAAKERGVEGYLLRLVAPTIQPALASLRDREVRRRLHEAATGRGLGAAGGVDTRPLVLEIARLRAERARLLGYRDHASFVIADQTAGSVEAVLGTLGAMAAPAMANLERERAAIAAALRADGVEDEVRPWDWTHYTARVREATYDLDTAALRPWFSLDRVLHDGVFHAAERLYGLTFVLREDLPGYAPGVRAYEVRDGDTADAPVLGLFLCDWFARPTKRGGAWMDEFVSQSRLLEQKPVVVVCLNVTPPPPGQPALMTVEEVRTAFHEFGHALHGLLSDVTYPRVAGTRVPRDFVEFPSQVNEMWAWDPDVLASYARHVDTGEPLPDGLAARLVAAGEHGKGFDTVAMLGAALLDLEWHLLAPEEVPTDPGAVEAFETAALARHGLLSELVPPRYRTGYFAHAFTYGYDAGYYSYLWSEVLDADTVDWFTENGGATRANGRHFRERLLARGGSVEPMAAFAAVRGRGPVPEPFLRRRGLVR
jgi:peptidyl-dipeptidase Dcp